MYEFAIANKNIDPVLKERHIMSLFRDRHVGISTIAKLLDSKGCSIRNLTGMSQISGLIKGKYAISKDFRIDNSGVNISARNTKMVCDAIDGIINQVLQEKELESNRKYQDSNRSLIMAHSEKDGVISDKSPQLFDDIIMECQDMISVETGVKKAYEKWLTGDKVKIRPYIEMTCSDRFKSELRRGIICLPISIFSFVVFVSSFVSFVSFEYFPKWSIIPGILFAVVSICTGVNAIFEMRFHKGQYRIGIKRTGKKRKADENSKFQFLKESYQGTIQKLNIRLEDVLLRINEQIQAHQRDKKEILENSDLFDNTDQVIIKIDVAISELRESEEKVILKQGDIKRTMNEYLGENGYISQKEKEIERIKKAQEISERMQKNFDTTLEIVKNVDVLTDAIIPGIKQLMEFKIPELIRDVEFKCDKERVLLGIR